VSPFRRPHRPVGDHYTVENARLYSCSERPPDVIVAAGGPGSSTMAGELGDGIITTAPDENLIETFEKAGGEGPRYGQATVCWG
jgi:alkanesulfonate monooxygenase SsuD/methylene tetrahydromethanopterin reductase-like flavin-dependent oxidoreductase (luciferase family)